MTSKTLLIDLDQTLLGGHPRLFKYFFGLRFCWQMLQRKIDPITSLRFLVKFQKQLETTPNLHQARTQFQKMILLCSEVTNLSYEKSELALRGIIFSTFAKNNSFFFQIEEASDFINWASRQFRLVLIANSLWPLDIIELQLDWVGLKLNHFVFISHAENMHSTKPHLQYYQEILRNLRLRPEKTLLITGDLPSNESAEFLGIPIFALGRNGSFSDLKRTLAPVGPSVFAPEGRIESI